MKPALSAGKAKLSLREEKPLSVIKRGSSKAHFIKTATLKSQKELLFINFITYVLNSFINIYCADFFRI